MGPHHDRFRWGFDRLASLSFIVLTACACLAACSSSYPVGHAKRSLDPAGFPQAASGQGFEVAVVRATEGAGGYDYSGTRLLPVLLVFKNTGADQPQVILEDVRGVGVDGEYLVYTPDEALRLAMAKTFLKQAGKTAGYGAVGAGVGAAVGAGAGALLGALSDKNHQAYHPTVIAEGAAVGGGAGALIGMASSGSSVSDEQRAAILADLKSNAWQEDPIPAGTTRMGYLLLPEGLGIQTVRLVIRGDSGDETRTLPIAQPKDYDPARAKSLTRSASLPQPKPAPAATTKNEEPPLPQPKQAPKTQDI